MKVNIFLKVLENYKNNFEKLKDRRFHFVARLSLWFGDEFAKEKLTEIKAEYIGKNEKEYAEKIKSILEEDQESKDFLFGKERKKFFEKYPFLKRYNKLLFRVLFCETIYGLDLRPLVARYLKVEDFIKLRNQLWQDKEAISVLSTHAVNYFYTLDYYLKEERTIIESAYLFEIARTEDILQTKNSVILKVYLLTHCIIGESAFYTRKIKRNKKIYTKMFFELEKIIAENYQHVSLDNKVEFLVCAKLCRQESFLREQILTELQTSYSPKCRCFFEKGKRKDEETFRKGEHRNVLALMAFLPVKGTRQKGVF
jgi:hypothetical protein